jgi:hypothetical protein
MRPSVWHPPVERSSAAQVIIKRIHRAKLLVFLRQDHYELCSNPLQQELAALSTDRPAGHPPVPPAQLALETILQPYTGVSDDEVSEATTRDRRW